MVRVYERVFLIIQRHRLNEVDGEKCYRLCGESYIENSFNCWKALKLYHYNVIGNDKRECIKSIWMILSGQYDDNNKYCV